MNRPPLSSLPAPRFAPAQGLDRSTALQLKRPGHEDWPDPPSRKKRRQRTTSHQEQGSAAPTSLRSEPPSTSTAVPRPQQGAAALVDDPPGRFNQWLNLVRLRPELFPSTWTGTREAWQATARAEEAWLKGQTDDARSNEILRTAWRMLAESNPEEDRIRSAIALEIDQRRKAYAAAARLPPLPLVGMDALPTASVAAPARPKQITTIIIEDSPEPEAPPAKPSAVALPSPSLSDGCHSRSSSGGFTSVIRPPTVRVRVSNPLSRPNGAPAGPSTSSSSAGTALVVYGSDFFIPPPSPPDVAPALLPPIASTPLRPPSSGAPLLPPTRAPRPASPPAPCPVLPPASAVPSSSSTAQRPSTSPTDSRSLPLAQPQPPPQQPSHRPSPPRPAQHQQLPQAPPRQSTRSTPSSANYVREAVGVYFAGHQLPWALAESYSDWRRTEGVDNAHQWVGNWLLRAGWTSEEAVEILASLATVAGSETGVSQEEIDRRARVTSESLRMEVLWKSAKTEAAHLAAHLFQREAQQHELERKVHQDQIQQLQAQRASQQQWPNPQHRPSVSPHIPQHAFHPSSSSPHIGTSARPHPAPLQGEQQTQQGGVLQGTEAPPISANLTRTDQRRRSSGGLSHHPRDLDPQQQQPFAHPGVSPHHPQPPTFAQPRSPSYSRPTTSPATPVTRHHASALSPSLPRGAIALEQAPPRPAEVSARDRLIQSLPPHLDAMQRFVDSVNSGEIGRSASILEQQWQSRQAAVERATAEAGAVRGSV